MKKKSNKITNVKHIKSVEIPVPKTKKQKFIYSVVSVDNRFHKDENGKPYINRSRTWSFWTTQKLAIKSGIFGWSDAEAHYESGSYTHIVIEKIPLNDCMPYMVEDDSRIWFEFVPEEANKQSHDIRKAIIPCDCPDERKNVIGFF